MICYLVVDYVNSYVMPLSTNKDPLCTSISTILKILVKNILNIRMLHLDCSD